ncbi:MAG: hypothetical protein PHZ04_03275 [Patescibacteria group bacterium]|nr:hypothetical protein [Patescibacteria group bacterium]MDD5294363.1 hypothetical protein [Patescibacteria group bacterium]MDD5554193.1 hypothetical protein [Patescibacteria group bacterium]
MPRAKKKTGKSSLPDKAKKEVVPVIIEKEAKPLPKIGKVLRPSSSSAVNTGYNFKKQNKNFKKLEPSPLRPPALPAERGRQSKASEAVSASPSLGGPAGKEAKKNMNSPKINLYRKIAVSFIVLTVVLLGVIFYFSFVKLNIVLIPAQERLSDSLAIDIYGNGSEPAVPGKSLTGIVEQTSIEEKNTYSASGSEKIGEEVTGKVTVINNYNKNQPLVATTRLLSPDNKLFRIKNTINVPAGGSQEVEIYADEVSADMAIGPTKFTIPGLWAGLQDKIYAESKEKFVYGQQAKKYIQQSDIDQAIKDLKRSLLEKAKNELGENYKGYNEVIYSVDENTISTEVNGKVGEEKDKFDVSMKAMVTIVAFSGDEAGKMAKGKLEEVVPDNKELIEFKPEEINYTLNNFDLETGRATVNATFEGKMSLKGGADIIDRQKIVNLTRAQLEDYLSGFKEIAGYEINFFPSFIDKVPNLADRIKIEMKK